jgi:hypothetical protein
LICSINSRALLESPGRAAGSCRVMLLLLIGEAAKVGDGSFG